MKSLLKKTFETLLYNPSWQQSLLNLTYRKYEETVFENLVKAGFNEVLSGPFKGLKLNTTYSNKNFRTVHILGFFETCLQKNLMDLLKNHTNIINIGCGSGYYTNGIAVYASKHNKKFNVKGYDIDPKQIKTANQLTQFNGLDEVEHILSHTDTDYSFLEKEKSLCIIDIEGGEYDLLKQQQSSFANCDMIIEIHETEQHNTKQGQEFLSKIFDNTHTSEVITEFKFIDFSVLDKIAKCLGKIPYLGLHILCCENRKINMSWLVLTSR